MEKGAHGVVLRSAMQQAGEGGEPLAWVVGGGENSQCGGSELGEVKRQNQDGAGPHPSPAGNGAPGPAFALTNN